MMVLKPGSLFASHYEVVRVLSAGGMGIVYEVIHRDTKRRRALKVMLPHVVTDSEMRSRFALEAVVTADIESEHLVEVFDAGIDPESDSPYIVMELLRGEDLGARLRRNDRCSPKELVSLFEQAALALEKTHAAGIVHRDLKPENLFLTKRDDGTPRLKILDFGIAKIIRSSSTDPKSTTKTFGTPYYMAREQVTGEALLIGPSSDTYALAHIAYAMLVGRPYFDDEAQGGQGNMLALLMAVGKGPQEAASARASRLGIALPPGFDAWFARATRADPRRRFASAREMTDELALVLQGLPPHPLPCSLEPPPAATSDAPVEPRAIGGTVPLPSSSSPPEPLVPEAQDAASGPPAAPRPAPAATPSAPSQTASPTFSTTSSARLERRPRRGVVAGVFGLGVLVTIGLVAVFSQGTKEGLQAGAPATAEVVATTEAPARERPTGAATEPEVTASAGPGPSASISAAPAASSAPVVASAPPKPAARPPVPAKTAEPVWKTR